MKNKKAEIIKWMGGILDALRELGGSGTPKEVSSKIAEIKKNSARATRRKVKLWISKISQPSLLGKAIFSMGRIVRVNKERSVDII
jgi:hypothetical protein